MISYYFRSEYMPSNFPLMYTVVISKWAAIVKESNLLNDIMKLSEPKVWNLIRNDVAWNHLE